VARLRRRRRGLLNRIERRTVARGHTVRELHLLSRGRRLRVPNLPCQRWILLAGGQDSPQTAERMATVAITVPDATSALLPQICRAAPATISPRSEPRFAGVARLSPSRRSDLPWAELRDWTLRQRGRRCVGRTRRRSDPATLALSRGSTPSRLLDGRWSASTAKSSPGGISLRPRGGRSCARFSAKQPRFRLGQRRRSLLFPTICASLRLIAR
jgi:hypothetical protein